MNETGFEVKLNLFGHIFLNQKIFIFLIKIKKKSVFSWHSTNLSLSAISSHLRTENMCASAVFNYFKAWHRYFESKYVCFVNSYCFLYFVSLIMHMNSWPIYKW